MSKTFNSIFKKTGFQIKKNSSLENERSYYKNTINCLEDLYSHRAKSSRINFNEEITGIIFSKNRAMQLHALLNSYFHYTENPAALKVLFTTDSPEHEASYKFIKQEFKPFPIEFINENNFRDQLKSVVQETKSDRIFFMTDDAIFLENYNLSDVFNFNPMEEIFSLRLGKDINFSFAYNKEQELPDFKSEVRSNRQFCTWIWGDMKNSPEWSYPLSVDATVFGRDELNIIFKHINFKNPNSLEGSLQILNNVFLLRKGVCYEKAKYVNIPCNVVQNDFENIFTGTYSVSELLKLFLEGKRINWESCKGMNPKNIQHIKYNFI